MIKITYCVYNFNIVLINIMAYLYYVFLIFTLKQSMLIKNPG